LTVIEGSPVVGMYPKDLEAIKIPTLVFNSSRLDVHHPRYITEQLASILPNSELVEPPFGEREWYERMGDPASGLFLNLPKIAPQLLEFERK
jgi:hypothetical protein